MNKCVLMVPMTSKNSSVSLVKMHLVTLVICAVMRIIVTIAGKATILMAAIAVLAMIPSRRIVPIAQLHHV